MTKEPCNNCQDCQCHESAGANRPAYRIRTVEQLWDALKRFCERKSVMSVPVDEERDADIILGDGIKELVELRGQVAAMRNGTTLLFEELLSEWVRLEEAHIEEFSGATDKELGALPAREQTWRDKLAQALAPEAGKALLDRLQKAEARVKELEENARKAATWIRASLGVRTFLEHALYYTQGATEAPQEEGKATP